MEKTSEKEMKWGETLNGTATERSIEYEVDHARVIQNDPFLKRNLKMKRIYLVALLMLASLIGKMLTKETGYWTLIPGVVFLYVLFRYNLLRAVKPDSPYVSGMITPAMIVKTEPVTLAAMSLVNMNEGDEPVRGFKTFTVPDLPGQELRVGEKIPCSSLFGGPMPLARVYSEFEPHPLCWATADKKVYEEAVEVISSELEGEWEALEQVAAQLVDDPAVKKNKMVFLDENYNAFDIKDRY